MDDEVNENEESEPGTSSIPSNEDQDFTKQTEVKQPYERLQSFKSTIYHFFGWN